MSNEMGEIDKYIGIQRRISPSRVEKLRDYVKSPDATFPTSIIVAVPQECASYDENTCILRLSEYMDSDNPEGSVTYDNIAKILDGQHRIRAFATSDGKSFQFDFDGEGDYELSVSVFVGADLPTQATIFSIVNLAQTKVNKSLVYDLFALAKTRSPQKSAHLIAVSLDKKEKSPLFKSIKRLGTATPNRKPGSETLTQAAFVEALVPYLTDDKDKDRDFFLIDPEGTPPVIWNARSKAPLFRSLFLAQDEGRIAQILWSYFDAVVNRWPRAWNELEKGVILKRTNGFRALMSVFGDYYSAALGRRPIGEFIAFEEFERIFGFTEIEDDGFTAEIFQPGSAGESKLKKEFVSGLERWKKKQAEESIFS